jgi:hypothetical protein
MGLIYLYLYLYLLRILSWAVRAYGVNETLDAYIV